MESHAHTLYVILQGEFALSRQRIEHSDHDILHIRAPELPKDNPHVYKAGPWHSDWECMEELPGKTLHLHHAMGDRKQGAKSEKPRHHPRTIPEKNGDVLMSCGPETNARSSPRVHIIAPIPLAILSGLAETTKDATITHTPANGCPVTRPATSNAAVILILVYKWHGRRPLLREDGGDRVWETGGPDEYQSIHVFASSPTEEDKPCHAKEAFAAAAKLLGENACIDWPDGTFFRRIAATPPAGLTWAQVNLFLSEVICLKGNPILDQEFVDVRELPNWEPERGGQSTNCGPVTGDDDGND